MKFLKIPQGINSQNGNPSGKGTMPYVVYGDKVSQICTFIYDLP
jgi:hypothetical protein